MLQYIHAVVLLFSAVLSSIATEYMFRFFMLLMLFAVAYGLLIAAMRVAKK